eukprot:TRINITY_DN15102_c0_g2_i7.p1 TRINITY_DN15102_c0_g2~~TRINITY_DN15102_c0_g2_i7.p1  ORF type:complete len:181 (-),score=18.78 TRINITY_DN15102_c0_g2_i7:195-737(-)
MKCTADVTVPTMCTVGVAMQPSPLWPVMLGPVDRLDDDALLRVGEFLPVEALRVFSMCSERCHLLSSLIWRTRLADDFKVPAAASSAATIYGCLHRLNRVQWCSDVTTHPLAPRISPLCAIHRSRIIVCGGSTRPLAAAPLEPGEDLLPFDTILCVNTSASPIAFSDEQTEGEAPSPRDS